MGTSRSYSGPTGKNPLLPPWVDDEVDGEITSPGSSQATTPANNEEANTSPVQSLSGLESWGNVKGSFTRFASQPSFSNTGARGTMRGFVRAQGGATNASKISRRGRNVAQSIGGVLAGLSEHGEKLVYNSFNFQECVGKKTSELLSILVDLVVPDNDDLESMVARNAAVEAFQKLFEIFDVNSKGLEALKNVSLENMKIVFQTYLSEYIFGSLLNKVGQKLEKMSPKDAKKCETWVKGYIASKVELDLSNTNFTALNWKGSDGKAFVQNIFQQAYTLIGA